ncbi:MAG: Gfo/Idh/MocA family protein [Planctomycetota bacterium]
MTASNAQPLRIGYVGCGFMAQKVHLPNLLKTPGVTVTAVAEVRPILGETVRRRFGIPRAVRDHRELAALADLDAVAISGHYSGQGEMAIDLLKAGKHVFLEKPMAVSVVQADRILAAERASGKRLMIAYMKRYDAGNRRVKALVDQFRASNELGALTFVRNHGFGGDWTAGLDTPFDQTDEPVPPSPSAWPDWLPAAEQNGYINYLQQYTHNINLMRWFLGGTRENTRVHSVTLGPDGVAGVVVLTINGVTCSLESGWLSAHGWDEHTQLYFRKGWVKTEAPPLLLRNTSATVELYRAEGAEKQLSTLHPAERCTWAYAQEIRHFVECLRSGEPFHSSAQDALHDVGILEDIYRMRCGVAEAAVQR